MNEQTKAVSTNAKKLVVLGTAHQLQGKNFQCSIDDQCFRDLIEQLICTHKIDLVFEEASGHAPTHAQEMASSLPKPIGHVDVDLPRDLRPMHGLSGKTGEGFLVDTSESQPCEARTEYVGKHEDREKYWLDRILQEDFAFALMICGHAHCLSFSFRLRDAGFDVEKCITYIPYDKLCKHAK